MESDDVQPSSSYVISDLGRVRVVHGCSELRSRWLLREEAKAPETAPEFGIPYTEEE